MPRTARFQIAAIQDLLRQLEYAPPETRRRQMDAAELLVADIDPSSHYPQDYITFRITGYRSDRVEEPVNFVGAALIPDLVNMVYLLSAGLDLRTDDPARPGVGIAEIASRLHVSAKSVQRYRKQGLVCHVMTFPDGGRRLACSEEAMERFGRRHNQRLGEASRFTRIDEALRQAIIQQARDLRGATRCSLNEAALKLARVHDRAHETIRLLLRSHDRAAAEPIFSDRGPLTEREQRVIHRAWQWGIEPGELARQFGKSKPTIHRAVNRIRRDHLRMIRMSFVSLPTFELPDAARVILSSPYVTAGLQPQDSRDLLKLIERAHEASPLVEDVEDGLLAAYNLLKKRAAQGIAGLGDWPGSEVLDAIETDLRWGLLLERRLIDLGLPTALRRIEQNLGRPLQTLPGEEIVRWLKLAVDMAAQAAESIDSSRGQRLERLAGMAMDKAIARQGDVRQASRAAARHAPGSITFDGIGPLHSWEAHLRPRSDVRERLAGLDERQRQAITLRHGLDGTPPLTVAAIAVRMEIKPVWAARLLQAATHAMRAIHDPRRSA